MAQEPPKAAPDALGIGLLSLGGDQNALGEAPSQHCFRRGHPRVRANIGTNVVCR